MKSRGIIPALTPKTYDPSTLGGKLWYLSTPGFYLQWNKILQSFILMTQQSSWLFTISSFDQQWWKHDPHVSPLLQRDVCPQHSRQFCLTRKTLFDVQSTGYVPYGSTSRVNDACELAARCLAGQPASDDSPDTRTKNTFISHWCLSLQGGEQLSLSPSWWRTWRRKIEKQMCTNWEGVNYFFVFTHIY